MNRIIKCKVEHEFIRGAGQVIGAAGSHDDVELELDFSEVWHGTSRRIVWFDALGEHPVTTMLTTNLLAPGETEIYRVPVPAQCKALAGDMMLTIRGVNVSGDVETRAVVTATAEFKVLEAVWDQNAVESGDITPTESDRFQAEIEAIKADIVEAGKAADAKERAEGYAEIARSEAAEAANSVNRAERAAAAAAGYEKTAGEHAAGAEDAKAGAEMAKKAIEDLTVSVETLEPEQAATVEKSRKDGHEHLAFGIPRGKKGDTGPQGIQGPQGPQGMQGPQGIQGESGEGLRILGYYDTKGELEEAQREAVPGDAYGVGMEEPYEIYVWDGVGKRWKNNGTIQGPKGETGEQGPQGPVGPAGPQGAQGETGPQGAAPVKGVDYFTPQEIGEIETAAAAKSADRTLSNLSDAVQALEHLGAFANGGNFGAAHPTNDLNDAADGLWKVAGAANMPAGDNGILLHKTYDVNYAFQLFHVYGWAVSYRFRYLGQWQPWRKIFALDGHSTPAEIIGFWPVQQGGGAGQEGNKIHIGWSGTALKVQVDTVDMGEIMVARNHGAKVFTGGYVGTGAYGETTPCTLVFPFEPEMVTIVADTLQSNDAGTVLIRGQTTSAGIGVNGTTSSSYAMVLNWTGNTMTWHSNGGADRQLNANGVTYRYCAIGKGAYTNEA